MRARIVSAVCFALAIGGAAASSRPAAQADRIYVNGKIWTGDDARPSAEALAVRGDRIVAVGAAEAVRELAGAGVPEVDLVGRRVVPGFHDAHWHLPTRRQAELSGAGAVAEIQRRMREWAA